MAVIRNVTQSRVSLNTVRGYSFVYPLYNPAPSPSPLSPPLSISGPVPGIPPNIDTTVPGKFTMQTKDGALLSTDPKASHSTLSYSI